MGILSLDTYSRHILTKALTPVTRVVPAFDPTKHILVTTSHTIHPDVHILLAIPPDQYHAFASFHLAEMPGNCGMLISYHSYINPNVRQKGLGTILNEARVQIARDLGYSLLIATDRLANTAQQRIFQKVGWKEVVQFTNAYTKNRIGLHVYHLGSE